MCACVCPYRRWPQVTINFDEPNAPDDLCDAVQGGIDLAASAVRRKVPVYCRPLPVCNLLSRLLFRVALSRSFWSARGGGALPSGPSPDFKFAPALSLSLRWTLFHPDSLHTHAHPFHTHAPLHTQAALPVHYLTDDDALTVAGEPSYANVLATLAVAPGKCSSGAPCDTSSTSSSSEAVSGAPVGGYTYEFDAYLLAPFADPAVDFINDAATDDAGDVAALSFVAFLNGQLEEKGFTARAARASAALTR